MSCRIPCWGARRHFSGFWSSTLIWKHDQGQVSSPVYELCADRGAIHKWGHQLLLAFWTLPPCFYLFVITVYSGNSKLGFVTNFVYYSACSLCYKTIGVTKNIRLLLRDGLLFRRLLLPESTVYAYELIFIPTYIFSKIDHCVVTYLPLRGTKFQQPTSNSHHLLAELLSRSSLKHELQIKI